MPMMIRTIGLSGPNCCRLATGVLALVEMIVSVELLFVLGGKDA